MNLRNIRAVTFDAGGTLLEPWPSVGHVYAAAARPHLALEADPGILNRQFHEAWKQRGEFDYSLGGWKDLVRQTFDGVHSEPDKFFDQLYRRFEEPDAWRIFGDVVPTLEFLRDRGLKLAVISNWDERLRPLLQRLGLAVYFQEITLSIEVGATKPSPAIFEYTLQKLNLPAEKVLHIGDSQREDYLGPQALGMTALLVKRAREGEAGPHILSSLLQLRELVDGSRTHL